MLFYEIPLHKACIIHIYVLECDVESDHACQANLPRLWSIEPRAR